MKRFIERMILLSIITFSSTIIYGQVLKPTKITDSTIIRIINNVRSTKSFPIGDWTITVTEVANETGTANIPETEEVLVNIYIGIIESDLYPQQNVFCIKDLYSFSNVRVDKTVSDKPIVIFNYIDITNKDKPIKKECKVRVTLTEATIIK